MRRRLAALALALLLVGCMMPKGTMSMQFPALDATWTAPDLVHASAEGSIKGRDIRDATVVAYLVAGPCPGRFEIPTSWLARNETALPSVGRFNIDYRLNLDARVSESEPYAIMVGSRHPDVVPERGWCSEFTAEPGVVGQAVYP